MLSTNYRGRWVNPRIAWSCVTGHPQDQVSHPICHLTQRQSSLCQQTQLKLSPEFNTYGTSRGTFKTGWILSSTCREITCFLVEGDLLLSFCTATLPSSAPAQAGTSSMWWQNRGASRVAPLAPLTDTVRKDSRSQKGCFQDCSRLR